MRRIGLLLVLTVSALLTSCAAGWAYEAPDAPLACSAPLVEPKLPDAAGATLDPVAGGYFVDDRAMARLSAEGPACEVRLEQCMGLRGVSCDELADAEAEIARLRSERAWVVIGAVGVQVVVVVAALLAAGG